MFQRTFVPPIYSCLTLCLTTAFWALVMLLLSGKAWALTASDIHITKDSHGLNIVIENTGVSKLDHLLRSG